jgi:tight adherence protein B
MALQPLLLLALAGVMLLVVVVLLSGGKERRRMQERVRLVGGSAPGPTLRQDTLPPSIRIDMPRQSPLRRRLAALLCFNAESVAERVLPWQVVAAGGVVIGLLAFWRLDAWFGPVPGLLGAPIAGALAVRAFFQWEQRRYANAIFVQLPDTFGTIVRVVRAGLPMNEALRSLAREMPSPTREAFHRVVSEIAIGRSPEAALWGLYEQTKLTECAFFSVLIGLQAQTGGSLTEALEGLADMVRKRVAMKGRARALSSEARMSAAILGILPFIAATGLSFIQPGYLDIFFNTERGFALLMTALTLLALGMLTIRWLIARSMAE